MLTTAVVALGSGLVGAVTGLENLSGKPGSTARVGRRTWCSVLPPIKMSASVGNTVPDTKRQEARRVRPDPDQVDPSRRVSGTEEWASLTGVASARSIVVIHC